LFILNTLNLLQIYESLLYCSWSFLTRK